MNKDDSNNEDDGKLFSDGGLRGDAAASQMTSASVSQSSRRRTRLTPRGINPRDVTKSKRTSYPPAQAVLLEVSISIVGEGMRAPKIDSTTNPWTLNPSVLATSVSSEVGHGEVVNVDCIEERAVTEADANTVGIVKNNTTTNLVTSNQGPERVPPLSSP